MNYAPTPTPTPTHTPTPTPIQRQNLLAAVKSGDLSLFKSLLKEYQVPPCYTSPDDQTPLYVACTFGRIEIVRYLVTPNQTAWYSCNHLQGSCGVMVLRQACFFGYIEIVKVLLGKIGDYTKLGWKQDSPLEVAESLNRTEIADMLRAHLKRIESEKSKKSGSGPNLTYRQLTTEDLSHSSLSKEQITKLVEVAVKTGNSKLICRLYAKELMHCDFRLDVINSPHHHVLKFAAKEAEQQEKCFPNQKRVLEPIVLCLLEDAFRYYDVKIKKKSIEFDKAAFWILELLTRLQDRGAIWHFAQVISKIDTKLCFLPPKILEFAVNQLCGRCGYNGYHVLLDSTLKKHADKIRTSESIMVALLEAAASRNHPEINQFAIEVLESM